ncbi:unnamed protein product [Phaeothamnion confervicola]
MAAVEQLLRDVATCLRYSVDGLSGPEAECVASEVCEAAAAGALVERRDVEEQLRLNLPTDLLPEATELDDLSDDLLRAALKAFPAARHAVRRNAQAAAGNVQNASNGGSNNGGAAGINEEEDDEEEETGEGECGLCGREMPLTRHHLYPRTTHKRLKRKGMEMATLTRCVDICRPCHSAVHRAHDEDTLAASYHTLAALRADPSVARFAAWAAKQRATRRADALNPALHYRR